MAAAKAKAARRRLLAGAQRTVERGNTVSTHQRTFCGSMPGLGGGEPDRLLAVEALSLEGAHSARDGGHSFSRCQGLSTHGVVLSWSWMGMTAVTTRSLVHALAASEANRLWVSVFRQRGRPGGWRALSLLLAYAAASAQPPVDTAAPFAAGSSERNARSAITIARPISAAPIRYARWKPELSASAAEWPSATPSQELFVSSVTESLQEAAEHPDAHPMYWAV